VFFWLTSPVGILQISRAPQPAQRLLPLLGVNGAIAGAIRLRVIEIDPSRRRHLAIPLPTRTAVALVHAPGLRIDDEIAGSVSTRVIGVHAHIGRARGLGEDDPYTMSVARLVICDTSR
jgi:hypothetical protein